MEFNRFNPSNYHKDTLVDFVRGVDHLIFRINNGTQTEQLDLLAMGKHEEGYDGEDVYFIIWGKTKDASVQVLHGQRKDLCVQENE